MKRRRWFEVHSWIGVVTGLLMFLICWSGTVAVLSHEIDWLLDARLRVEPSAERASWGELHAAVRRAMPDATGISLQAPLGPRFVAVAIVDTPQQSMLRVYLDPATAEVRGHSSYFNVQRFFRSLHMSLFDFGSGRGWGYWFVGVFGVLLLLSALTPLLFYRRWWRGFFSLRRGRGRRVLWSELHKLIGAWSLLFAWVIALTGVWYLSEWFGADFGSAEREPVEAVVEAPHLPLDRQIALAGQAWPDLEIHSLTVPEHSYWGPVLYVEGQADAWLVRDRANYMMLDPASGAVVQQQRAADVEWPARWAATADPLHFGDFGGLPVKLLWFVLGLALCLLSLSGAYLHGKRLQAAHDGRGRAGWTGTRSAVVASVLVLLLTTWAGWQEWKSYGPMIDGVRTGPEVPLAIGLFIAGWVAATLVLFGFWLRLLLGRPRSAVADRAMQLLAEAR